MVFNWFRRQFSDSSQADPQVEETQTAQDQLEAKPSEESEPPQEPPSQAAADYLNWAKAAYKNIQQQQVGEEKPPEPFESLAQPPAVEVPDQGTVSQLSESIQETTCSQTHEPETGLITEQTAQEKVQPSSLETQEQAISVSDPQISAVLTNGSETVANPLPEAVVSDESESAQPNDLPFWAREDRQARLEKLKAAAIEEEPDPTVIAQPTSMIEGTQAKEFLSAEFAFDEGFLWSAEVLASQGRRPDQVSLEEISWLKRLRQGLEKTRRSLINQLKAIVGQGPLNQDAVIEIEALLLQADVGVEATDTIIKKLQEKLREEVLPPEQAIAYLKTILRGMLDQPFQGSYSPTFAPEKDTLNIWLMTGVNGAGKTTTIGKIAHLAQKSGYKCLIGAADTFRAAAVEQVKIWGERSGTEVIANTGKNTDPAAVVFDAIAAAQARGTEMLLIDTAGRLQNKKNLMDELSKIRRIVDKKASNAKVESLLVLDATLGQNGLRQAQVFSEAAKLSGVVLTKLDGTAKGGVALAVVQQMGLPIRFIGAGEGIEDLRPFSSYEFVEALLSG
jgi:fused signal recognition particle receptor